MPGFTLRVDGVYCNKLEFINLFLLMYPLGSWNCEQTALAVLG